MDILGKRFEIITASTGTLNTAGRVYYAFMPIGGSATITAVPNAGHSATLTDWELADGCPISSIEGFSSVAKTAGTGKVIAYYN